MVNGIALLLTAMVFAAPGTNSPSNNPPAPDRIRLSQRQVAERLLQQGDRSREILLQAEQTKLALAQVNSVYDFNLALESGYEMSKIPNFLGTQPDKDQTYKSTLSVNKPFSTGTLLGLEYTRISKKTDYPIGSTVTVPSEQTEDYFGVSLQQSLLKNVFGRADRAKLRAAESTYQAAQTSRNDNLQNLVLEGIRLFWRTYVAQETFNEALNSRERYNKLVEAVRKKTSYGYNNPGELAQVQAELEVRNQNVKTKSNDYLAATQDLITLLRLSPNSEIEFDVPQDLPKPPPPTAKDKKVEELRPYKALQKVYEAASDSYLSSDNSTLPDLALVGRYYQYGLKPSASEATAEMSGGSKPDYYIGVKVTYSFGSGVQGEDANNKRLGKELAATVLSRRELELKDSLEKTNRNVQSTYAIVESAKQQRTFREKAAQELSRAYNQGRTDINTLITSLNNYFDSEITYTKSIGDYLTALNEYAAIRDELIPDSRTEMKK